MARSLYAQPAADQAQTSRLLLCLLLIWSEAHPPEDESGGGSRVAECLKRAAPAEVVRPVFGGDTMEAAQPFLQPSMVSIDVVEVEIGRVRVRLAGSRQDMRRDPGVAREAAAGARGPAPVLARGDPGRA